MIIGENTILSRSFLAKALAASKSVGRLVRRKDNGETYPIGTGFITSLSFLITNNHQIPSKEDAENCELWLDYFENVDGTFAQKIKLKFSPDTLFVTSPELDVTIVAIDKQLPEFNNIRNREFIEISTAPALIGEHLNIVHHPNGEPLKFSIRQGKLVQLQDHFLHYTSPTSRGSSGAPIFNDHWELLGIHRSGVPETDKNGNILLVNGGVYKDLSDIQSIKWIANQGIRIESIIQWIASIDPNLSMSLFSGINKNTIIKKSLPKVIHQPPLIKGNDQIERDAVFLSYAHKDQEISKWQERLDLHLKTIPKIGERSVWQDGRINPGEEWRNEIDLALKRTKVAVLLIGPHFLVSDFIMNKELPELLESAKLSGVKIFPLITHHVAYSLSSLSKFQSFNSPEKPLEDLAKNGDAEKKLVDLVKKIASLY